MAMIRRLGPPTSEDRYLDRFGAALLLTLASIVSLALIDTRQSAVGSVITHALSGAALIGAVAASGVSERWRRITYAFVMVVLAANIVFALVSPPELTESGALEYRPELLWLGAAAVLPVVITRRIVHHTTVTVATILGAVAAYLQLAVAFAFAFQAVDALSQEPFFGQPVSTTTYMYVSLQTISTLGYGDSVPATDLGRLVAMSEAVIGQVYLVTFVAMIVSLFAASIPERRRERGAGDDA
jgi:hypothetical protein